MQKKIDEQQKKYFQRALDPRYSAYVDAAAGSGKTTMLLLRLLRLCLHKEPHRVLCITYTTSAAAEIIERLEAILKSWVTLDDRQLLAELAGLGEGERFSAELLERARGLLAIFHRQPPRIQTLHSFCLAVLQRRGSEIAKVIDELQAKSFVEEICAEYYRDLLLGSAAAVGDGAAAEALAVQRQALELLLSYYSEEALFEAIFPLRNKLETDEQTTMRERLADFLAAEDAGEASAERGGGGRLVDLLAAVAANPAFAADEAWQGIAGQLQRQNGWSVAFSQAYKLFYTNEQRPRSRLPGGKRAEKLLPMLLEIQRHLGEWWQANEDRRIAELEAGFVVVAYGAVQRYRDFKRANRYYEYDDLIKNALSLLQCRERGPSLLYDVEYDIDHVLVDEAQDLSEQQWRIVNLLTAEFYAGHGRKNERCTVFIVGDFKQSIFGFQGAAPHIFQAIRAYYESQCRAAQRLWVELKMYKNYRSPATIIDEVNRIFADWPQHEAVEPMRNGIFAELDNNEPGRLAAMIEGWVAGGRRLADDPAGSAINYRDIMILVRRNNSYTQELIGQLTALGIPCQGVGSGQMDELVRRLQYTALVARFVAQPDDNLVLFTLLKSPLYQVDEEMVLQIFSRICFERQFSLWREMLFLAELTDCEGWLQQLVDKLGQLLKIYRESQQAVIFYFRCWRELGLGAEDGIVSWEMWRQVLGEFAASGWGDHLVDFLAWYDDFGREVAVKIVARGKGGKSKMVAVTAGAGGNMEAAAVENKADAVQISTIHSAKGLEAPVVIIADIFVKYHKPYQLFEMRRAGSVEGGEGAEAAEQARAAEDGAIFSAGLSQGDGGRGGDSGERITYGGRPISAAEQAREAEEERRLFYVAMTRATAELYLYRGGKSRR